MAVTWTKSCISVVSDISHQRAYLEKPCYKILHGSFLRGPSPHSIHPYRSTKHHAPERVEGSTFAWKRPWLQKSGLDWTKSFVSVVSGMHRRAYLEKMCHKSRITRIQPYRLRSTPSCLRPNTASVRKWNGELWHTLQRTTGMAALTWTGGTHANPR